MAARLTLLLSFLTLARLVFASDTGLSGSDGHPRERFPLATYVQPLGDATLDAIVTRAINDWDVVVRETLGVQAFAAGAPREKAQVVVEFEPATSPRVMGETDVHGDVAGVIALPVRVIVFEPRARGQTSRETVLYQIVAHELGHVLGLVHTRDPHSLMCCVAGSVDFKDPAARQAYIEARRHPDVRSVRGQLAEHYERFWHGQN
jgi:hypothetical protein